jgi:hypothetical protein
MPVQQESLALDFLRRVPHVPVLHVGVFGSAYVGRPSEAVGYKSYANHNANFQLSTAS